MDAPANFTVDATPVTTNGDGKVRAVVTTPSGAKAELPIDNKKNGIYTGSYMPIEQGNLHLFWLTLPKYSEQKFLNCQFYKTNPEIWFAFYN